MKLSHRLASRSRAIHNSSLLAFAVTAAVAGIARASGTNQWVGGNTGWDGSFAIPGSTYNATTGTNDKFENPNNWQNNFVPPGNDPTFGLHIGNGSPTDGLNHTPATATFDQNTMVALGLVGGTYNVGSVAISDATGNSGTLVMNGGTISSVVQFGIGGWGSNSGASGNLVMSGGQINASESTTVPALTVGYSLSNLNVQSSGTIMLTAGTSGTGGTINFAGAHMSVGGRNSIGYVDQRSGLVTGGTLQIGAGTTGSNGGSSNGGAGQYFLSGNGAVAVGTLTVGLAKPNQIVAAGITPIDSFAISSGELSAGTVNTLNNMLTTTSFTFTGGTVTANYFTMQLNQSGGTLSPGNGGTVGGGTQVGSIVLGEETNTVRVNAGNANYMQTGGTLLIDINGNNTDPTIASNNDVVHLENDGSTSVNLTASLNGTISLRLAPGYTPSTSDVFGIVTADSITHGTAAVTTAPITGNSDIFTPSVVDGASVPTSLNNTFGSGSILELAFTGYAKFGDANKDQIVNSADFAALAMHYGRTSASNTVGWEEGDFNGDGTVNALDFNALANDYGATGFLTTPPMADLPDGAAPAALGSVVPEPFSMAFIAIGGLSLFRPRRKNAAK